MHMSYCHVVYLIVSYDFQWQLWSCSTLSNSDANIFYKDLHILGPAYIEFGCNEQISLIKSLTAMLKSLVTTSTYLE